MHLINRLYAEEFDFPSRPDRPTHTVMVASVPRSGSTHFVMGLWRTGKLGAPMEYINLATLQGSIVRRLGGDDVLNYWRAVQRVRASPNGVFGYKSFVQNFLLIGKQHQDLLPLIESDSVIYYTRRDKIAQAISYARAIQTKTWFAGIEGAAEPEYDLNAILRAEVMIGKQERSWERIFRVKEVDPIRVYYEDFLSDPDATVRKIGQALSIEIDDCAALDIPDLEKQADSVSSSWRERYERERPRRTADQRE